jgi:VanZ family protein
MKYRQAMRSIPFWLALLTLSIMALKSTPTGQLYDGADKLYHWLGFSILIFTAHLAFPRVRLLSLCIGAVLGAGAIELLQLLSVDRTASLDDMTVNLVGIITGLGLTTLLPKQPPAPQHYRHGGTTRKRRRRRESMERPVEELS